LSGSFVPAAFDAFNMLSISGTRTGDLSFKNLQGAPGKYFTSAHVAPNFTLTANTTTANTWTGLAGTLEWTTAATGAGVPNACTTHSFIDGRIDHHRFRIGTGQQRDLCGNCAVHQRHVHQRRLGFACGLNSLTLRSANGVLDVHGNSTLSGGTINAGGGAFANAADGTVTISSSLTLNGTLTNAGTFTQTTGQLLVNNPFGRFLNQPGGIYNQQSTVNPSMTGSGYFLNSGTFAKFGAGTTGISTPFFNRPVAWCRFKAAFST
jgi:hypothetical protein